MKVPPEARLWLVALGLSLGPAASNGLARFAYGLVLPAMRADLNWTYAEAGWINTANAGGYLIGAVLTFHLISREGPHRLFVGGMALTAVTLLLSATTRDIWILTIWRVGAGIGGAAVFIAGSTLASSLFRDDNSRSALAIAIYFGGAGLGVVLSGLALPILLDRMGNAAWPEAWIALGMASAGAFLPSLWAVRAVKAPRPGAAQAKPAPLPGRAMIPALIGYFFFATGYIVYVTFLIAWMRENKATPELVAVTWMVLGVAVMLSPFPWRPVLARSSGGAAMALACAGTALGTLLPLAVAGNGALLLSAALFGLSFFIVPSAASTFARKNLAQDQWGASFSLFTIVFAVGQIIGPVAAGAIGDWAKDISQGVVAAGFVLLAGALAAACQRKLG